MKDARAWLGAQLRTFWPSAPFWLLAAFWGVQGELRWDHLALALLATFLASWSDWTRRLCLGILPLGLVGVLYDSMRVVKNVGLSRDNVHVCDVRAIDQRFFGLELNGARATWHDYLQQHSTPFLDVLLRHPVRDFPGRDDRLRGVLVPPRLPGPAAFHLVVFGFERGRLHHLPRVSRGAALVLPPTTVARWISPRTRARVPYLARVDAWLGIPYFAGMYGRASDVFGAVPVPSLHVAYPLLLLIDGFRRHRWLGRVLLIWFYLSMCFAAVYLDHHWVFDIVIGSLYAVVVSLVIRRVFAARSGVRSGRESSTGRVALSR